ncbi:MAG: oxygen-independent coproporphyrinogen III oxidase [Planctomycetota bacterium]
MLTGEIPPDLFARYDQPGPRYTSYPTAPVWSEAFTEEDYRQRLAAAGERSGEPLSIYVHVPYCASMCWYCACSVVISKDPAKGDAYVDTLLKEAALARRCRGAEREVVQHHWGGGTPTSLRPAAIRRLFSGLGELFPVREDAEVSVEVDPRITTREHLEALAEAGINRVSMGVQDFSEEVQRAIHRMQSVEQTKAVVDTARELGFRSANIDMVYGLPFQTPERFQQTLEAVREIGPDRVACYSYAHVPWLKKHQRLIPESALPRGGQKLVLYRQALRFFLDSGYEAIGMDHFARANDDLAIAAREGRLHRNFMGYTTFPASDMLSFGVTAIGEVDGAFAQNVKDVPEWRSRVLAGELPVHRGHRRSAEDSARRAIILDLMCRFRLRFADHGGADRFRAAYAAELEDLAPMIDDGLCSVGGEGIEVTELGRLFVRNIAMVFDAYLRDGSRAGRFSRTV